MKNFNEQLYAGVQLVETLKEKPTLKKVIQFQFTLSKVKHNKNLTTQVGPTQSSQEIVISGEGIGIANDLNGSIGDTDKDSPLNHNSLD